VFKKKLGASLEGSDVFATQARLRSLIVASHGHASATRLTGAIPTRPAATALWWMSRHERVGRANPRIPPRPGTVGPAGRRSASSAGRSWPASTSVSSSRHPQSAPSWLARGGRAGTCASGVAGGRRGSKIDAVIGPSRAVAAIW